MPSCTAASFNNNNGGDRPANPLPRRKFSFPAVLQSQSLCAELGGGAGFGNGGGPSLAVATARRRFSNVSDVVSRKLSHTIGWRTAVPTEQIARQGKALCTQYIRWKLKRAGVYTKKCAGALRSARASAASCAPTADGGGGGGYFISSQAGDGNGRGDDEVRREVFPAVLRIGLQLERLNPKLYATGVTAACPTAVPAAAATAAATSAANNAAAAATAGAAATVVATAGGGTAVGSRGRPPSQLLLLHRRSAYTRRNSTTAAVVLVSVSRELFRAGAQVTWAKVVSLVCVAAGLAVDCARRGRGEQLADLIETVGEVIEDDLAAWIHYNGGWVGTSSCNIRVTTTRVVRSVVKERIPKGTIPGINFSFKMRRNRLQYFSRE